MQVCTRWFAVAALGLSMSFAGCDCGPGDATSNGSTSSGTGHPGVIGGDNGGGSASTGTGTTGSGNSTGTSTGSGVGGCPMPCPPEQVCANGGCYPIECDGGECPIGQACIAGSCYPVRCGELACPLGDVCAGGHCVPGDCISGDCVDAGPLDAGPEDAGPADAGPIDAGFDAGPPDSGPPDGGTCFKCVTSTNSCSLDSQPPQPDGSCPAGYDFNVPECSGCWQCAAGDAYCTSTSCCGTWTSNGVVGGNCTCYGCNDWGYASDENSACVAAQANTRAASGGFCPWPSGQNTAFCGYAGYSGTSNWYQGAQAGGCDCFFSCGSSNACCVAPGFPAADPSACCTGKFGACLGGQGSNCCCLPSGRGSNDAAECCSGALTTSGSNTFCT